ncbi:MAG TPA: hypothetical protein VG817_08255 [Gemmatimonadales bacterium]|nr:hypothetical protein [Gemmatimonadales bacterium]
MRHPNLPSLGLLLAVLSTPAAAQQPGKIQGAGGRPGAGEIHVVGQTVGAQKIHFTSEFKVEPSKALHAVLSPNLMAGDGTADLGPISSEGEQLIDVPAHVDVSAFAVLLVYDTGSGMVVASTPLPNARGRAYAGMKDTTATRAY